MQYILLFLEGIITFISPCLLPMLPVYVSYFAGGNAGKDGRFAGSRSVLLNATGFVVGFTVIFVIMGAFAGSIGRLFMMHQTAVNIVTGSIVVLFGLSYMGLFSLRFPVFAGPKNSGHAWFLSGWVSSLKRRVERPQSFSTSVVFGAVFSIGWTPCITAFLGAALMRASQRGSTLEGMLMLFIYSMGLGIPFIAGALLIGRLKSAFAFIQRHYRVINAVAGGFLVMVGVLMITGQFDRFLAIFL